MVNPGQGTFEGLLEVETGKRAAADIERIQRFWWCYRQLKVEILTRLRCNRLWVLSRLPGWDIMASLGDSVEETRHHCNLDVFA